MEYTHLGRSGLLVSRLCLGTLALGPEAAEALCAELGVRPAHVAPAWLLSRPGIFPGYRPAPEDYAW